MVDVRAGEVNEFPVAPEIGLVVTPEVPAYHWKVGKVPEALTVKEAVLPLLMVTETGWATIAGAVGGPAVAVRV